MIFNCDFEMFEPGMGAHALNLSIRETKLGGTPQTRFRSKVRPCSHGTGEATWSPLQRPRTETPAHLRVTFSSRYQEPPNLRYSECLLPAKKGPAHRGPLPRI